MEPVEAACAQEKAAQRPRENWFQISFAGENGKHILCLLGKPSGSSLYPPNPPVISVFTTQSYHRVARELQINAVSFSDFAETHQRPLPNLINNLIKLDTQGSELDILRSLKPPHWADLLAVQSKIEFVEMHKGQPLFGDVDKFMKAQGFELYDILPVRGYRTRDSDMHHYLHKYLGISRKRRDISFRLIAGDALYLWPLPEIIAKGDRRVYAKMRLILLTHRFLDEALWFIEQGMAANILAEREGRAAIRTVQEVVPRPSLRQRGDAVGRLVRKVARMTGCGQKRVIEYWLDRKWDY